MRFLVSHVLHNEVRDPRLGFVTVLGVELTLDLKEAKVRISVLGSDADRSKCMHALTNATGFIQSRVGRSLNLRNTPAIRFVMDDGQDSIARIENILQRVKKEKDEGDHHG
jgi:ribosome-binding factor A